MSFTTKGRALASRDQPQEAGAEESGAARDRGRHRCERIDETRPRDPHRASRVSLGASGLKDGHREGDDARLLVAAIWSAPLIVDSSARSMSQGLRVLV